MNRSRVILFVTLLPSAIVILLVLRSYASKALEPDSVVAVSAGTEIHGVKSGGELPAAVFAADPAFDRNLNSKSIQTDAGIALNEALRGNFSVIRYDQRGTGRTAGNSRFTPVSVLAADLRAVAPDDAVIIAHGDSCATAAYAWKKGMRARKWIFVSCAYSGTLVDSWAERMFYNMQNSLMPPDVIRQCRAEWKLFRAGLKKTISGSTEAPPVAPAKEGESPDLLVFRGAIRELAYDQRAWTKEALEFDVARTVQEMKRSEKLVWFLPEFDTLTVPSETEAMSKVLGSPRILPGTDYFLLESNAPRRTAMERIFFLKNPFTKANNGSAGIIADAAR